MNPVKLEPTFFYQRIEKITVTKERKTKEKLQLL